MKRAYLLLIPLLALSSFNSRSQTVVEFYTSMGNFTVTLNETYAPITVWNFRSLVAEKFYDGIIFHRVIDGFMIQGGDPTGTGFGGSDSTIPDEFHDSLSNLQKTISMANAGPNTATSQFFINLVNNTYLDYNKPPSSSKHAVFGEVTANFSVVQAIGKVATNSADKPLTDVVIDSIRETYSPTAIPEPVSKVKDFICAPNPTENDLDIRIKLLESTSIELRVFDVKGAQIGNTLSGTGSEFNYKLSQIISNPSPGIYFIAVEETGGVRNFRRILIQ